MRVYTAAGQHYRVWIGWSFIGCNLLLLNILYRRVHYRNGKVLWEWLDWVHTTGQLYPCAVSENARWCPQRFQGIWLIFIDHLWDC